MAQLVLGCAFAASSAPSPLPLGTNGLMMAFSPSPTALEISSAVVFEESLVPIGGEPTAAENAALANALTRYSSRATPDDFSHLTEFLEQHPRSPWRASLLTGLGLHYYDAAYYSLALEAWREAWSLGRQATDARGKFLADRAVCELAHMLTSLGRMEELEALLDSVAKRPFIGGAAERIHLAREALSMMKFQPDISFRCGPLALLSIKKASDQAGFGDQPIYDSQSTTQGFSLPQVAKLSAAVGLNYQMALREQKGALVIPSVVHWKVGHYAALVRQEGDWYQLEDPTFGNTTVWATKQALEAETSGYFLIPPGDLPPGWRRVGDAEGEAVWGRGVTSGIDPDNYTPEDEQGGSCPVEDGMGMAVSSVHLGIVNLQVKDTPVGYVPPVGPPVRFTVRFNQRDYLQPASQISTLLGPNWTHDWHAYIRDVPATPAANVKYFVGGGGARTFTGFNNNTLTFSPQQLDQVRLTRPSANRYEMLFPDGSKKIFGSRQSNRVFLTQVMDPAGNAATLTWSGSSLVAITDAIGQVTRIAYEHASGSPLITKVTDPFGRFATFDYSSFNLLLDTDNNISTPSIAVTVYAVTRITDVLGINSQFNYSIQGNTNLVLTGLTTPYGTTSYAGGQGGGPSGSTRFMDTIYPDGSRERVEFSQNTNGIAFSDPASVLPQGMNVFNRYLHGRNTFYWDRNASAQGRGDYSKAKIYHWLHSPNIATTAGILESIKEPLERRVWYSYSGQGTAFHAVGDSDRPTRIGRVLDDGTTQLFTYAYNSLGHVTNSVDPVGREMSYIFATNGIDLLEVRQTRGANNELLSRATYNTQHRPLTVTDASGQATINTYNSRGQLLTTSNPKGETATYTYNADGYLTAVDGSLPGADDTITTTYDAFGRVRTRTDVSGYTITYDYDVMDRVTRTTFPDGTFNQHTYDRLDLVAVRDSAGRETFYTYDAMRQLVRQTDPLGQVTRFEWCSCGSLGSLTDPMGRKTEWHFDVQGRLARKQFGDGSGISYIYEDTTSRLRQVIDEKQQLGHYLYYRDNTLKSVAYANATVPTPGVSYTYDPNYERVASMTDGVGTTVYSYVPVTASPSLGAGRMASIDGPLPNDTITFGYDELGRRVSTAINGMATLMSHDAAGRVVGETNALGSFTYGYEGSSGRLVSQSFPNSQTMELSYGDNLQDRTLQRITYKVGAAPVSESLYGHNVPAGQITTWSQRIGALSPNLHTFGYDAANQLLSATVTNGGTPVNAFAYAYDPAGNRLTEQVGVANHLATYNPLNQLSTTTTPGASRTNDWDAADRLVAVNTGRDRTEFTYDTFSRLASLRSLTNGVEASFRRFVWRGRHICEERDASGVVTKRFFGQGMKVESGTNAGNYYYTRDHLGSIRGVTDGGGNVRARYAYDPYGRRTRLTGDMEADFGFAGMFWSAEVQLSLTRFRAYDAELGRWLSRDPLQNAEVIAGPNLYAYVVNDPINHTDPEGLISDSFKVALLTTELGVALGYAGQRVAPALQSGASAMARCSQAIYGRVQALLERAPQALRQSQQYLADLVDDVPSGDRLLNFARGGQPLYYPGYPLFLTEMDIAFTEAAALIAQRYGISLAEASALLTRMTGYLPLGG